MYSYFYSSIADPPWQAETRREALQIAGKRRLVAATAKAIAEAARALGNLLLLDGNNVDGDAVEL